MTTAKKRSKFSLLFVAIIKHRSFYIMLLPGLIFFFLFAYKPMYGAIIAFKDFNVGDGIAASPWADPWYKHFEQFFNSPFSSQIINNTIVISSIKIFLGTFCSIILALLLNECQSQFYKRLVQTVTYMPYFLSWVVVAGIAFAFFSEGSGIVNKLIVRFGGTAIPFLTSNNYFRGILYGTNIWRNMGYSAIIYLASIAGIGEELYEAARVDGAGRFRRIWHITLPGIRSTIVMLLIINIGTVLNAGFDQVFAMYNEQVYQTADIIDTWVYRRGILSMDFEIASAVGLLKSVFGFVLVFCANQIARRWDESIW